MISISTMPAGKDVLKYVKEVEQYANFMHLDVCDGVYNSTKCFLPEIAMQINQNSTIPLDCHLMAKNAKKLAGEYIKAGANIVSAQIESFEGDKQIDEFISFVKSNNALVGLCLEPKTSIDAVLPYLEKLDVVVIMTVKTGASGQNFDQSVLHKIQWLADHKKEHKLSYKIEVDGGINDKNIDMVKHAGAEIIVSGSYVFNAKNREQSIKTLKD